MADWAALILRVGEEQGYWPKREIVSTADRFRPGASDVIALRVGYEKLNRETGWEPQVSWEDGVARTFEIVARCASDQVVDKSSSTGFFTKSGSPSFALRAANDRRIASKT